MSNKDTCYCANPESCPARCAHIKVLAQHARMLQVLRWAVEPYATAEPKDTPMWVDSARAVIAAVMRG
jgi:hypothetical protein